MGVVVGASLCHWVRDCVVFWARSKAVADVVLKAVTKKNKPGSGSKRFIVRINTLWALRLMEHRGHKTRGSSSYCSA